MVFGWFCLFISVISFRGLIRYAGEKLKIWEAFRGKEVNLRLSECLIETKIETIKSKRSYESYLGTIKSICPLYMRYIGHWISGILCFPHFNKLVFFSLNVLDLNLFPMKSGVFVTNNCLSAWWWITNKLNLNLKLNVESQSMHANII